MCRGVALARFSGSGATDPRGKPEKVVNLMGIHRQGLLGRKFEMSVVLPGTRTGREPERSIRRGPRRLPAEVVAATQRDRLLDGIVRTVAHNGYARARISDICQAAGVTRPV